MKWTRYWSIHSFHSISFPQRRSIETALLTTLPKPSTKSVIYTLMEKTEIVAVYENMAFIQFVGDQPVYTHIVELKYESSDKLACILSILGRFHVEMKSK